MTCCRFVMAGNEHGTHRLGSAARQARNLGGEARTIAYVRMLGENIRDKRLAIINPSDETGWGQPEFSEKTFEQNRFEIVGNELYEQTLKDFQPMFAKILIRNPDVIDLGSTSPPTSGLMVRQARELGYKGMFVKVAGKKAA